MSNATAHIPDATAPDPSEDRPGWRASVLAELVELNMRAARALVGRIEAVAAAAPEGAAPSRSAAELTLSLSRVSRSVRLTVDLIDRPAAAARPAPSQARSQGQAAAGSPDEDARDATALEDRRRAGTLRRAMTRFICETAVEAREREAPEAETLMARVDARLEQEGPDPLDFEHVDVKALALSICRALGVDPGADWWWKGWGIETPDATGPP